MAVKMRYSRALVALNSPIKFGTKRWTFPVMLTIGTFRSDYDYEYEYDF